MIHNKYMTNIINMIIIKSQYNKKNNYKIIAKLIYNINKLFIYISFNK